MTFMEYFKKEADLIARSIHGLGLIDESLVSIDVVVEESFKKHLVYTAVYSSGDEISFSDGTFCMNNFVHHSLDDYGKDELYEAE